jgi:hypothetical protein
VLFIYYIEEKLDMSHFVVRSAYAFNDNAHAF